MRCPPGIVETTYVVCLRTKLPAYLGPISGRRRLVTESFRGESRHGASDICRDEWFESRTRR
ncbi:uncharacterized protein FFB20_13601 [Fusarium fujikuroi]|nr:uncharacterized protein FFE2_03749 [Fusarium fujikuroi]SCN79315.1 uncharacterized protein FFM5_02082 [Fusarium fujikuroi]SCN95509.1 uncharacterized protein FFC1_07331 [Fusarium fujikuroi]SCO10689.1 uncharacterized protein FFB20_13601 [Fusarium fujikuroi]SCO33363.1 uncharacterized protein FFMR_03007 [Fusarium fujikuroi]